MPFVYGLAGGARLSLCSTLPRDWKEKNGGSGEAPRPEDEIGTPDMQLTVMNALASSLVAVDPQRRPLEGRERGKKKYSAGETCPPSPASHSARP